MHDYLASEILKQVHEQTELLRTIRQILQHNIQGGRIRRIGDTMTPINPGSAPQYAVTVTPADATFIASDSVWTTSDETNAPITPSDDGKSVVVNIPSTAPLGSTFVITWSYTNADGTTATAAVTETIVAPVVDVTGGTVAQAA